jgi:hypothetical protein
LRERRIDAVGHEAEFRAALHRERRARVMREHVHGHADTAARRPTSLSSLSSGHGPRTGPEHVAAEDPQRRRFSKPLAAIVLSTPVSPPSWPCMRCPELRRQKTTP